MTDTIVALGGFIFSPGTFAVPEVVNGGGAQALTVHTLIGGVRVVDAMGFVPDQIRMRGRFRGAAASIQARLVETIVRSGNMVTFSYWTNRYQVVGADIRWLFQRFYEIGYELTLTVIADLTQQAFQGLIDTLDSAFDGDFSLVSSASSVVPTVSTVMAGIATARAAIGTLQGASPASLLPLAGTVTSALGVAAGAQASTGAAVTAAAGGVTAGGNATAMAGSLASQATNMLQHAGSVLSNAVLGRMSTNLATAPQ